MERLQVALVHQPQQKLRPMQLCKCMATCRREKEAALAACCVCCVCCASSCSICQC